MSDSAIVTFALVAAVTGIVYGLYLAMWVFKLNAGNAKMQEISGDSGRCGAYEPSIQDGGRGGCRVVCRAVGARGCFGQIRHVDGGWILDRCRRQRLAGYVGMIIGAGKCTTAQAAHEGMNAALTVAFRGGAVTGLLLIDWGCWPSRDFIRSPRSLPGRERRFMRYSASDSAAV